MSQNISDGGDGAVHGPLQPAIRVLMMPKDTNALGTIFGGIILSYIDQAGAVEAHRHTAGRLVTVSMREVVFHAPVFVGDLVSFFTETLRLGRTSISVKVTVEAERGYHGTGRVKVTEAEIVYVHVDRNNRPVPLAAGQEGGGEEEG
ncbi:MAG TPA: acyl-CoA thioesterase [Thermoanaerobaculia bacterium]|nr:acyl-CoA thioesterase [Thermoanaerobaculia bacterium]